MSDIHLEKRKVEEVDMVKSREVETKNEIEKNSEARVFIRNKKRRMVSLKKIKRKMGRKKNQNNTERIEKERQDEKLHLL